VKIRAERKDFRKKRNADSYMCKWEFTFGADPEFEVYDEDGKFIPAEDLCDRFTSEKHKFLKLGFGNVDTHRSQVGMDGGGESIELRPRPANTPEGIVKNIKKLMKKLDNNGIEISSEGNNTPLGGHIHMGFKSKNHIYREKYDKRYSRDNHNMWDDYECNEYLKLSRVLDFYLGKVSLLGNGSNRDESGYGNLGDVRKNQHGLEYRTPPVAIFNTPRMALISFRICELILDKILNKREEFEVDNRGTSTEGYIKRLTNLGIKKKDARYFVNTLMNLGDSEYNVVKNWMK